MTNEEGEPSNRKKRRKGDDGVEKAVRLHRRCKFPLEDERRAERDSCGSWQVLALCSDFVDDFPPDMRLPLLATDERNPLVTSTRGTGELVRDTLDRGSFWRSCGKTNRAVQCQRTALKVVRRAGFGPATL